MPSRTGSVHVATTRRVYNDRVYETHLLRRTYREDGKVKHETLGNISHLPADLIETIRHRLRTGEPQGPGSFKILRSLPHGHVLAILTVLRRIGLDRDLASRPCRERDLVIAIIVARIINPASKLATVRALRSETCDSSLGLELELGEIQDREVYEALDWLVKRQGKIEKRLAQRHLQDGTLVLYDVSSSYYNGRKSELVPYGYKRDRRREFPQIVYGLLCNAEGCPVAIDVFPGNMADANTLSAQVEKVRKRFGIKRVVIVGDRGLITSKRIDDTFCNVEGLDWITALRADCIKKLVADGQVQPSLFDERNLAEITSPDFPIERLVVCRNPALAEERKRKRQELLAATEKELEAIAAATRRAQRPLQGKDKIGLRVGRVLNRFKVGKHYILTIEEGGFSYQRDQSKIDAEAALDGIHIVRTSTPAKNITTEGVVLSYKQLIKVERAFRSLRTNDIRIRPIYHWLDNRICAHAFLCMLSYYVEWHVRKPLAPLLFDGHQRESAEASPECVVDKAPRSEAASNKDANKLTADGTPVHSFRTLLKDLGTLAKNRVRMENSTAEFSMLTQATPLQQQVFNLLGINPAT